MPTRDNEFSISRRKTLRLAGGGLLLIPVVNVLGCSDSSNGQPAPAAAPAAEPEPSAAPASAPEPAPMPETTEAAAPEPAADAPDAAMEPVDEADSSAQALGYRHDATTVDSAKYAKYEGGQQCGNCVLFMADASPDAAWGGCSIFPGRLVSSSGWCIVYQPKPA
jgi:hypothetical protein